MGSTRDGVMSEVGVCVRARFRVGLALGLVWGARVVVRAGVVVGLGLGVEPCQG